MKKIKKSTANLFNRLKTTQGILFIAIFLFHMFFRFHELEMRNQFMWDQIDNAWAAKNIIVEHKYPLVGMVAKQNSGFYIGPAYYYLVAAFYYMTNLDPIASALLAGLTSVFTFLILFFLTKKMFGTHVALVTIFIHTFSFHIIQHNRIQWPVNFIDPLSLIVFYALYQILLGKSKYVYLLAVAVGASFHVHFTSIFYLIFILLCLPLFPRTKQTLVHMLLSLPLFLVWFVPNIIAETSTKGKSTGNMMNYLTTYYHGFHLRRVLQVATEAFIEFESILLFKVLKPLKYAILPVFVGVFYWTKPSRERLLLCYLMIIWVVVPWFVFATYKGEITNYYFFLIRPVVLISLAYLSVRLFTSRFVLVKIAVVCFWLYYMYANVYLYFTTDIQGISDHKDNVKRAMKEGRIIQFTEGDPQSYIYYIYTRK